MPAYYAAQFLVPTTYSVILLYFSYVEVIKDSAV